jgi:hypothetical protein
MSGHIIPIVASGTPGAAPFSVRLFHQDDFRAFPGGANGGPTAGNAASQYQDIGLNFLLFFITYWIGPLESMPFSFLQFLPHIHLYILLI